MSITAECGTCGRRYQAPDAMAGKTVRCKQCGNTFEVPFGDDPLAAFDSDESVSQLSSTAVATPRPAETPKDDTRPFQGILPSARLNYPCASEVELFLPIVLAIGSLAGLAAVCFGQNESNVGWIGFVRLLVALIAYCLCIAPITTAFIKRSASQLGFRIPPNIRWRSFASYLAAFTLAYTIWVVGGGWLGALLLGCVGGLIVASLSLWVIVRLTPAQIAPAATYGGAGFLLGVLIASGVLFGLNALTMQAVGASKKSGVVPASPYGDGFAWIPPAEPEAPKPQIAMKSITPALTKPAAKPASEPAAPPPPGAPVVVTINSAPIQNAFDDILYPLTNSAFIGLIKIGENNSVQIDVYNNVDWSHTGSAKFPSVSREGDHYALSPGGESLARIGTFPRLSVQEWSVPKNHTARTAYLDDTIAQPRLLGYLDANRLLIHADAANGSVLLVIDLSKPAGNVQIETPSIESTGITLTVSIDGTMAGIASKINNIPTLSVFNLVSGQKISSVAIASLDPRWPVEPTGLAFARDGSSLSALFEQSGNGMLVSYRIDASKGEMTESAEHVYAAGLLPGIDTKPYCGNAISWLADGKHWLVYGRGVIDIASGNVVADLQTSAVKHAQFVSPDRLQLVSTQGDSGQQIATLRIDSKKIVDELK